MFFYPRSVHYDVIYFNELFEAAPCSSGKAAKPTQYENLLFSMCHTRLCVTVNGAYYD